jgi:hypothetical protein
MAMPKEHVADLADDVEGEDAADVEMGRGTQHAVTHGEAGDRGDDRPVKPVSPSKRRVKLRMRA